MRLVPALLFAACSVAVPASESLQLEAPGSSLSLGAGGVVTVAGSGFVARRGDWLLTGEALRWDQAGDSLFATGSIVLVLPEVRIHADSLGMHPEARTGDAWGVEAWVAHGERRLHVRAERIELTRDRLTFHGVAADFGQGGALSLRCPKLHIYLRDEPRLDKGPKEVDRFVEGIAAISPTVRVAGAPVLWFPYLYRDYILDYPWSKIEAGSSDRLGWWMRYQVGSNLPELAGWRTRLVARVDRYARAGNAAGLTAYWRHRTFGHGSATALRFARERVEDPADQGHEGGTRQASAYDAEHYVSGTGWAAAARWTALPDPDPSKSLPAERSPDERFRSDFLRDDLSEKPFARRGLAATWVTPLASFTADTERRPNDHLAQTERLLGLEAELPRLALIGPLAASGSWWTEELRRKIGDTSAVRSSWEGRLAAVRWMGGVAVDGAVGERGVFWNNGRIAGADLQSASEVAIPFAEAGVRIRTVADAGELRVTLTPRLGVELLGVADGEGNPGFDFGDRRDDPESDRQYLVTSLDAELAGSRVLRAEVTARWALRDQDRAAVDADGSTRTGAGRLADIRFRVRGRPLADVELKGDGTWDARLGRWLDFDARARWTALDRLDLLYEGIYVPPTATLGGAWLHRTGPSLRLNRYRLDGWIELRPGGDGRPGGRDVDLWHVGFTRRMVDGVLTTAYEHAADPLTGAIDNRWTLSFTVGGDAGDAAKPMQQAFGFTP